MDIRYVDSQIVERLEKIDPELHREYISKFPYRTGKVTNIDFEALLIEQMKCRMTRTEILEEYKKYGLSERTISRRIEDMKYANPKLYQLYKMYALYRRNPATQKIDYDRLFGEIGDLEDREVVLGERTDDRERELVNLEKQYLEFKKQGLSNSEIEGKMNMSFQVLYKRMLDLKRIRKEKECRKEELEIE